MITTISLLPLIVLLLQDIRTRSIHWSVLLILLVALGLDSVVSNGFQTAISMTLNNSLFLLVQGAFLVLYYILREKPLKSIINVSLGAGDILLLFIVTVAFSLFNFIFFYLLSLIFSILVWTLVRFFIKLSDRSVPLAGLISAWLIVVIIADTTFMEIDRYNDSKIIDLICRMIL